jgi:hypothetical protein
MVHCEEGRLILAAACTPSAVCGDDMLSEQTHPITLSREACALLLLRQLGVSVTPLGARLLD